MKNYVAYNTITGEIIACSTANALKRHIARITTWDVAHGYGYGKWVFTDKGIDALWEKGQDIKALTTINPGGKENA